MKNPRTFSLIEAIPSDLMMLRRAFRSQGFDIRFVGGCVRDALAGCTPKDFDLCTDADIIEQIDIYEEAGVAFYRTGEAHGTLSVKLGSGLYEITSLRTESNHDGRHATCVFTRDWEADLSRRDLTINAMALDFDGTLYDPFDGAKDLIEKKVRFVGEASDRMQEDYLRILRWLRFHGRFGRFGLDFHAVVAATDLAEGLREISRERVWSEMRRIISSSSAPYLLTRMATMGLLAPIDLDFTHLNLKALERLLQYHALRDAPDPVTCMVAFLSDRGSVLEIAEKWKWSRGERDKADFLATRSGQVLTNPEWLFGYFAYPRDWVVDLCKLRGEYDMSDKIAHWQVPEFPVRGADLIAAGMQQGPELGDCLTDLRCAWAERGYTMSREELLANISIPQVSG